MDLIIKEVTEEIIKIIDSKPKNISVAHQFIYEELEASYIGIKENEELINGLGFLEHRLATCGINKEKFLGSMEKSWDDIDGANGPQQTLLILTIKIRKKLGIEISTLFRISVIENIMAHYKMGKYSKKAQNKQEKKDINLFKIIVNDNELHTHFKHVLKPENEKIIQVLSEWASGFKDRDKKFVKEFQTTFNSSFWELYLYKCLKELNYQVDFDKSSPDFITYTPYSTLCIEATTANEARDDEPEWEKKEGIKDLEEFLNYASFRLYNAITSKHNKYIQDYSKLEYVKKKPYI
ncbi:MAG: hypothetical protein WBF48_11325, partial [Halarcobacter sp.]